MILAAFDFDGTMTYHDALIPFFRFAFGDSITYLKLIKLAPHLLGFPLGILSRQEAKERILAKFLQGLPLYAVETMAKHFAEGPLFAQVKPEAWQRFQWHKREGHRCILISANLSLFLQPWAEKAGFEKVLSSEIEVTENQMITGRLKGLNCWGPEKVRRLNDLYGPEKNYQLYAYGDSRGDTELLQIADFPFYRAF